jgi:cell division protein FtsN
MSMAHETDVRPLRSDDPYSRDTAPGGRNNDPLAELARLIGKEDPFAQLGRRPAPRADAPQAAPEWLARPEPPAYGRADADAPHDDHRYQHDPRHDDPNYVADAPHAAYAAQPEGYDAEAYYEDGQQPYGEEAYGEAPVERRRGGGLTIVAAVLGFAAIGAGGVFGYRAWMSPSGATGEPPVIKAEQTPTKIVPTTSSADNAANKQIYDRIGDKGGEKVVPREEQPVDVRSAARTTPAGSGPTSTGSVLPPLAAPPQQGMVAGTEPKKVKTVAIRPDQPNTGPMPTGTLRTPAAGPAPVATAPTAPTRSTSPAQPTPVRTASVAAGSYVVQVASQRTESDAQASFKALQSKYPAVLGSRQAVIRRADLGDKGVFYRAQVGPFSTQEDAAEMCDNLKAAGGQCVVQKN